MTRRALDRIEQELDRIRSLPLDELRREWEHLYRATAPRISRELLVLGLAYRLQERAYGGLSRAAQRKLASIATSLRKRRLIGTFRNRRRTMRLPRSLGDCGDERDVVRGP